MNNILSFYIAGLSFRPEKDQEVIKTGLALLLEAEPDNPYDNNAIKLVTFDDPRIHVGYVPKKQTKELHPYRIAEIPVFTVVVNHIPEMPSHKRVLVTVKSERELPRFIPEEKEFKNFICQKAIGE